MKGLRLLRSSRENLAGLSLDFNPRDLVGKWVPSAAASRCSHLEAIYVPTKGRVQYVLDLLHALDGHGTSVFLLPTHPEDIPPDCASRTRPVQHLFLQDDVDPLSVLRSLRSASNPLFTTPATVWDLPLKRNCALWHAQQNHFRQILLIDDDIRGVGEAVLRAGASALCHWAVAGMFIDAFPDTSVIGHIGLAVGKRVFPFLSGSCLFIRCDGPVGFFPQIYNEDWIFMAPHIASGNTCSLGSIRQEPYDPLSDPSRPIFQEPGEIIADGLFGLLDSGRYAQRLQRSVWSTILSKHREQLIALGGRTQDPLHRSAVESALAVCERITGSDCAEYVSDLEHDRRAWGRRLQEVA